MTNNIALINLNFLKLSTPHCRCPYVHLKYSTFISSLKLWCKIFNNSNTPYSGYVIILKKNDSVGVLNNGWSITCKEILHCFPWVQSGRRQVFFKNGNVDQFEDLPIHLQIRKLLFVNFKLLFHGSFSLTIRGIPRKLSEKIA